MNRPGWILPALALLGGCAASPPYVAPALDAPGRWTAAAKAAHAAPSREAPSVHAPRPWWHELEDPLLEQLMLEATARNFDLQLARARILEARAAHAVAAAALSPGITGGTRTGRRNTEPLGREQTTSLFEATFDAQWELDLFGGSAARVHAAQASESSLEHEAQNVQLTLRGELARNYIDLRTVQRRLKLARDTLAASRTLAELTGSLRDAGLRTELDATQALSLVLSLETRLPRLDTATVAAIRRIETLLGHLPGTLDEVLTEPRPVPVAARPAILDDPAEVLARRPDVQRAERSLAAAASLHRAAVADLFPKVSVGALFGIRDTSGNASLGIGALSAGLVAPIFNAGRLRAERQAAEARREQAHLAYRHTVLKALEDVEVSLVAYGNADRNRRALDRLVDNESQRLSLAQARYRRGIAPFSDVLEVQRSLYAAQEEQADAHAEAARGYVALAKSIGG